uniref:Kinesin 7-III protein n=1 Tax=Marsilea vestita TaxID=59764 RepID=A0A142KWA7_MARVE|nr:kinesin 7-III protein [Marsilea vestita]
MEKISVSVRVKPLDKAEVAKGIPWKIHNNAIALCPASGSQLPNHVFVFDNVFSMESTTEEIYNTTTKKIVSSAMDGFNGTVFAYGQTSSGKTFTMRGYDKDPGIIPLAIYDIFRNLEKADDREYLLHMSYMEIYNEDINDLLAPEQTKLQVHESLERGVFVSGLREEIVTSPEQALQLMEFGESRRHFGETNMNLHSSRSHTIFRLVIESRDKNQDDSIDLSCDSVRVSVLNLVDLAGSERVAKTGAEGTRLKEGTHINKSLMVLGTVINKLSEGIQGQGGHIPYRDSKLTRILQPALGGNARTAVICTITPAVIHVDESKGTLQFASRAMRVTNCAQVNEILTDAALLKKQKKEIEELKMKLKASRSENRDEEICALRNMLMKIEQEREKMYLMLQDEKKERAEEEQKQAKKIESLSNLVLNFNLFDFEDDKQKKKKARRKTWAPSMAEKNLDEISLNSLRDDGMMSHSRDRALPLPPPFDSLLVDDTSGNEGSPQIDDNYDIDIAFSNISSRKHVSDRKRKYTPEMPRLSKEDGNALKKQEHGHADVVGLTSPDLKEDVNINIDSHGQQQKDDDAVEDVKVESVGLTSPEIKEDVNINIDTLSQQEKVSTVLEQADGDSKSSVVHANTDECLARGEEQQKDVPQLSSEENNEMEKDIQGWQEKLDSAMDSIEKYKDMNTQLSARLVEAEESLKLHEQNLKESSELLEAAKAEVAVLQKSNEALKEQLAECLENNSILKSRVSDLENENSLFKSNEHSEVESLVNSLKKEKTELVAQLTEAYLKFEEEKAAFISSETAVPKFGVFDNSKKLNHLETQVVELQLELSVAKDSVEEEMAEKRLISEEAGRLKQKVTELERMLNASENNKESKDPLSEMENVECLRERYNELENIIRNKDQEKDELSRCMLEIESYKSSLQELKNELSTANSVMEQERNARMLEIRTLEEKMNELECRLNKERALREDDARHISDLQSKLSSLEEKLIQNENTFSKESWEMKSKMLKMQFTVDAVIAKAEVFHGRLLEAHDELKDLQTEVDRLKPLQSSVISKARSQDSDQLMTTEKQMSKSSNRRH